MGQKHSSEPQMLETVCQVLAKASSSSSYHTEVGGDRELVNLLSREGAELAIKALVEQRRSTRLQWRACQALWHITHLTVGAQEAEAAGAVEAGPTAMLGLPTEKAMQIAACATLENIIKHRRHRTQAPDGGFFRGALGAVIAAMHNFPAEMALQRHACCFLWQFATEDPGEVASRAGLKRLVEHAASLGIKDACKLSECVNWRTAAEVHVSRGGGRQRWGQWSTGLLAAF